MHVYKFEISTVGLSKGEVEKETHTPIMLFADQV